MMSAFEKNVHAEGHLIDSGLLSEVMDRIIREGARFKILAFRMGTTNEEPSEVDMHIECEDAGKLASLLEDLSALGFGELDPTPARREPAPAPGVAPEDFYSTTHHATEVFADGVWHRVSHQRMDACIVDRGQGMFECVKLRDLVPGDPVVVGLEGVRVMPEYVSRDRSDFSFMSDDVSSERQVRVAVERIAELIRETRKSSSQTS